MHDRDRDIIVPGPFSCKDQVSGYFNETDNMDNDTQRGTKRKRYEPPQEVCLSKPQIPSQ